jgi:glutamine---fructose-6-phosphate transaminase (isomerizing)
MQEVAARGARIIVIGPKGTAKNAAVETIASIDMPELPMEFAAISYAIPMQLLAYYTASVMGKDVDQPRNLAKSVTVE